MHESGGKSSRTFITFTYISRRERFQLNKYVSDVPSQLRLSTATTTDYRLSTEKEKERAEGGRGGEGEGRAIVSTKQNPARLDASRYHAVGNDKGEAVSESKFQPRL